ncbi:MAG: hypothetical protein ABEI52_03810, partial [Halobacteriaceae archaeon]
PGGRSQVPMQTVRFGAHHLCTKTHGAQVCRHVYFVAARLAVRRGSDESGADVHRQDAYPTGLDPETRSDVRLQ